MTTVQEQFDASDARIREYNRGYDDGIAGRPFDRTAGPEYEDGWYDGESDRPTLEEVTGVDTQKEMTDPFGY